MAVQTEGKGAVADQKAEKKAKYLLVRVVDHEKADHPVNIKMPIGLVKFGMKMAQTFSPDMKKADIDWDSLSAMIGEGAVGELVHVEDEAEHKTIDVRVE